jgi:hypothetical protein
VITTNGCESGEAWVDHGARSRDAARSIGRAGRRSLRAEDRAVPGFSRSRTATSAWTGGAMAVLLMNRSGVEAGGLTAAPDYDLTMRATLRSALRSTAEGASAPARGDISR